MVKQSSALIHKLAHNDPAIRDAAFVALTAYLQSPARSKLDLLELEKLWKGLWYSMWFCDKPIPQQNLAGSLGELFSTGVPQPLLANFHRAFWIIMRREWTQVDKWRLDKYLMLVRRVLRHLLFRLEAAKWPKKPLDEFLAVLRDYPLSGDPKFPQALAYHVCDLYVTELEYVVFKDFREYSEETDDDSEHEPFSDSEADSEELDVSDSDDDDEGELKPDEAAAEETKPKNASEKPRRHGSKKSLSETQASKEKQKVIARTPFKKLLSPFQEVLDTSRAKALKQKCKEEVFDDKRLVEWGVVEAAAPNSDDEWTGF